MTVKTLPSWKQEAAQYFSEALVLGNHDVTRFLESWQTEIAGSGKFRSSLLHSK